jgi:hypothetical protein
LDFVGVSIANQYSVCPWAFVSTVPMLVLRVEIVTVEAVVPTLDDEDAGALVFGADVLAGGDELPHAARTAAAPARIGAAHQRLRIFHLSRSRLPSLRISTYAGTAKFNSAAN